MGRRRSVPAVWLLLILILGIAPLAAEDSAPLEVGKPAPEFSLPGSDDQGTPPEYVYTREGDSATFTVQAATQCQGQRQGTEKQGRSLEHVELLLWHE